MKKNIKQRKVWKGTADRKKHSVHFRNRAVCVGIVCALAGALLTGCAPMADEGYTREELNNLARLELYEAESGTLLMTIEDADTLYQYCSTAGMASEDAYAAESEKDLQEAAEHAGASYCLEVYQYPAAKFGDRDPKKISTTTLYQGTNIAKIVVEDEAIKNISLPEELLTFYYEMPEEESMFYESLLEQVQ